MNLTGTVSIVMEMLLVELPVGAVLVQSFMM